jgi:hypothetical protein
LIQNPVVVQKSVGNDLKHYTSGIGFNSLPRKWVSLDDLESDKQMTGELDEEMFKSEDVVASKTLQSGSRNAVVEGGNKKSVGMPNSKSKCGQQGKCCHSVVAVVVMGICRNFGSSGNQPPKQPTF